MTKIIRTTFLRGQFFNATIDQWRVSSKSWTKCNCPLFLDTAPQFRTLFPSAARKKKKKTNEEKRKIERGRRKNKEERQSETGFFGPNKQKRYLSENMKIIGFYTDKNSLGKPPKKVIF